MLEVLPRSILIMSLPTPRESGDTPVSRIANARPPPRVANAGANPAFDIPRDSGYGLPMDAQRLPGPNAIAHGSFVVATLACVLGALSSGVLAVALLLGGLTLGIAGTATAPRVQRARQCLPREVCPPRGNGEVLESETHACLGYSDLPTRRWADELRAQTEIGASQRWP
jgi:hypothetical protein